MLLVIPISLKNPLPTPAVTVTGSNLGQIHGNSGPEGSGSNTFTQHLLERVRSFYLGSSPQAFFKISLSHGNSCQVKIAGSGWHDSHGKRHKGSVSVEICDTKEGEGVCFVLDTVISQQRAELGEGGVGIGKES